MWQVVRSLRFEVKVKQDTLYAQGLIEVPVFLFRKYSMISSLVNFKSFLLNLSRCILMNFTASNFF